MMFALAKTKRQAFKTRFGFCFHFLTPKRKQKEALLIGVTLDTVLVFWYYSLCGYSPGVYKMKVNTDMHW